MIDIQIDIEGHEKLARPVYYDAIQQLFYCGPSVTVLPVVMTVLCLLD